MSSVDDFLPLQSVGISATPATNEDLLRGASQDVITAEFFISNIVQEIGEIVKTHPYLSTILISSGIEFLGKCLDSNCTWDQEDLSRKHFKKALKSMPDYSYYKKIDLFDRLRCGMIHQLRPKQKIALSKSIPGHGLKLSDRNIIDINRLFYNFEEATKDVLNRIQTNEFKEGDKIYKPFQIIMYS